MKVGEGDGFAASRRDGDSGGGGGGGGGGYDDWEDLEG